MKRKIVKLHQDMVRTGKYHVAWNLLILLRTGYLVLGLGDCDWETETLLEKNNIHITYSRNGNWARVRLVA